MLQVLHGLVYLISEKFVYVVDGIESSIHLHIRVSGIGCSSRNFMSAFK